MKIVALIPARGGSKRIPRKNVRLFAGKPLIAWSIELAKECNLIDDVIVSTDDQEIADVARAWGANVPFLRPAEISGDLSTDYEVAKHYLEFCEQSGIVRPDIIVHLRPTYPNRTQNILMKTLQQFLVNCDKYDSLRTVVVNDKPAFKMYTISADNVLTPLFNKIGDVERPYDKPAQLLPQTMWHNGYIDIFKSSIIKETQSISGNRILPYILDPHEVDDIDTIDEWVAAEQKVVKIEYKNNNCK